jgi:hypothetical protein
VHIVGHWAADDEYMMGLDTVQNDPILAGSLRKHTADCVLPSWVSTRPFCF